MIFVSAGHNRLASKTGRIDVGAVGCDELYEADCTSIQRDATLSFLREKKVQYIQDLDSETLGEYLKRIRTGNGSVVLEYHFNGGPPKATGIETIVADDASELSLAFAKEINDALVDILNLKNRGVKTEGQTPRKRLGLMREEGIVALPEICFISNCSDMKAWSKNIMEIGKAHADILIKYENLI